MSKEHYLDYLKHRLLDVEARMKTARHHLERNDLESKVVAAGELKALEDRQKELKEKIDGVEREPESAWEDLKSEIDEDFDMITASIERWIAAH